MRTVYNFYKIILLVIFLGFHTSCNSSGSGDAGSTTPPGPVTTVVDHHFVFFSNCEGGCSNQFLYKYSFNDDAITQVGAGIFTGIDYSYSDSSPVIHQLNDLLYFSAEDGTNGFELWVYDPSQPEAQGNNPKIIDDINTGTNNSYPGHFEALNGKLYFGADNGTNGAELWVYEPDQAISSGQNPKMVYDINSGISGSNPRNLFSLNGKLYMKASTTSVGIELYVYDPTVAASATNPQLVSDIRPGTSSSNPKQITLLNGKLYFSANDGTNGIELWTYDPSIATSGTNPKIIYDLSTGVSSSSPDSFHVLNGKLYFSAYTSALGKELYVYDPTVSISATNPNLLYDLRSGSLSSSPNLMKSHNDKLYFTADAGTNSTELFVYDPSVALSASNPMEYDINPGSSDSRIEHIVSFQNKLFLGYRINLTQYFGFIDSTQPILSGTNPNSLTTLVLNYSTYDITPFTYSVTTTE